MSDSLQPPPPPDQLDADCEEQRRTMEKLSLMLIAKNRLYASELRRLGRCLAKVKTGYATPNEGDQCVSIFTAVREHLRKEASSSEKARRLETELERIKKDQETELERIKKDQESIASEIRQCLKIIKPDFPSPKDDELVRVLKDIGKHLTKLTSNEANLSKGIAQLKSEKETARRELVDGRVELREAKKEASDSKEAYNKIVDEKKKVEEDLRSKLQQAKSKAASAENKLKEFREKVSSQANIEFPGEDVDDIAKKVKRLADDHTRISKKLVKAKSRLKQAEVKASEMESAVSDIEIPQKMELLEKVRWLAHRHKDFVNSKLKISLANAANCGPYHHKLHIGEITQILGNEVEIEGAAKSRPLEKGDFLWISETGLPLGAIDEVSMPALVPSFVRAVKYVVKIGSAEEVPAGISSDAAVSCVLKHDGVVDHVLNAKDLIEDLM